MKDFLIVGDTLDFLTTVPDYPPDDGWTLKHVLTPRFTTPVQTPITLTATTSGTDYRTQIAPAVTSGWKSGAYAWWSYVEKSGAREQVDNGEVDLRPDPTATAQGYDGRTVAQKALDDCKAALANFSSTGGRVKRYQIAGREMEFDGAADIIALVSYWENEVSKEAAAKAVQDGLPNPRRYYVRMDNA